MKRQIIITADGSTTIQIPEWNEQYHSKHGAIQEAKHVFIKNGFCQFIKKKEINILEIGLGTGLNCFITLLESLEHGIKINYVGVEAYPVPLEEVSKLNYVAELNATKFEDKFEKIHSLFWDEKHNLSANFKLTKRKQFFEEINDEDDYDLIYFDAFGARIQPKLWTIGIFNKMYKALKTPGILVTYSAKGSVKRAMQQAGFNVEKLPGPPGKLEMLRATKS